MVKNAEFQEMIAALFRKSIQRIRKEHPADVNLQEIPYTVKQIISKSSADDHFNIKTMITTDGCDYTCDGGVMVCFKQKVKEINSFDLLLNSMIGFEDDHDSCREFFVALDKPEDTIDLIVNNTQCSIKQTIRMGNTAHLFSVYPNFHTATHDAEALNLFFNNAIHRYFDIMGGSVIEMNSRLAINNP